MTLSFPEPASGSRTGNLPRMMGVAQRILLRSAGAVERLRVDGFLDRLWSRLPYDGQGLAPPRDPDMAALRRWAAARFWRRVPWWARPVLAPAARLAWPPAALLRVARFARAMPAADARRLLADCLLGGARPVEALVWRRCFPEAAPHPLPGRAAALLLGQLGDPGDHRRLADKQVAAAMLAAAGLATPRLRALVAHGTAPDPADPLWTRPAALFVKPRHGWAGREAAAVDVLGDGTFRIGGNAAVDARAFLAHLAAGAALDDLLIQDRLTAAPELADLAADGPPVLRLTVAREPGGAPFLHSALLCIGVPDRNPRNFVHGQLWVPVDPVVGRLRQGIWFARPDERFARLPWNAAPLAGRDMPGFTVAVAMTLRAMAVLPGLPLVNWDLIPSPAGPVVLEGNTAGNWILTQLGAVDGPAGPPLAPLLRRWAEADPG